MNRAGNQKLSAQDLVIPVAAGKVIREAELVAVGTDGYAVPASASTGLTVAGCAQRFTDNSGGAAGDVTVLVRRGAFVWNNDGTIKGTDLLKDAYVSDAQTVTITSTGSSRAGKILAVDPDGITVETI